MKEVSPLHRAMRLAVILGYTALALWAPGDREWFTLLAVGFAIIFGRDVYPWRRKTGNPASSTTQALGAEASVLAAHATALGRGQEAMRLHRSSASVRSARLWLSCMTLCAVLALAVVAMTDLVPHEVRAVELAVQVGLSLLALAPAWVRALRPFRFELTGAGVIVETGSIRASLLMSDVTCLAVHQPRHEDATLVLWLAPDKLIGRPTFARDGYGGYLIAALRWLVEPTEEVVTQLQRRAGHRFVLTDESPDNFDVASLVQR